MRQVETTSCFSKSQLIGMIVLKGGIFVETKDIIFELRNKKGLSQEALAKKVLVTRQAVSRWETGVSQS